METASTNAVVREVTSEEVERYAREGWTKLEGLVDPEFVARMLKRAKEMMGSRGDEAEPRPGVEWDTSIWYEHAYLARDGVDPFQALTYSAAMGRNAQRMMAREVPVRHWLDQVTARPPAGEGKRDRQTSYHQDWAGSIFDRVGQCTFWIALHDIPADRGTMRFYSGSHREGPLGLEFGFADAAAEVTDTYPDLAERCPLSEPFDLKAGDATCHGGLVVHGAPQNTTEDTRWVYITLYFPADTLYTGAPFPVENLELAVNQPFDDPRCPIVYPVARCTQAAPDQADSSPSVVR